MAIQKVLIVDDARPDLMNLERIVSAAGYTTLTATNGQQAVEMSLLELGNGEDPVVMSFAREILIRQNVELGLLAAEITATTGRDPGDLYGHLARELGEPAYRRIDSPATAAQWSRPRTTG